MAIIMDGKVFANNIFDTIKLSIQDSKKRDFFLDQNGKVKSLAIIKIGNDPASEVYYKNIINDAKKCGFNTIDCNLSENCTMNEIILVIHKCNLDPSIAGIMLQLPIPHKTNCEVKQIIDTIDPSKDIDGITSHNKAELYNGNVNHTMHTMPCTPDAVMALLGYYNIELEGKHVVIVGRSNVVGKPLAMLMLQENATVTICHSHTKNLGEITKSADILVSATGCMHLIKRDMVKEGAAVVDVGIIRHHDGKLYGDVDFDNVKEVASHITPVPGGVGHATRAILFYKLMWACYNT